MAGKTGAGTGGPRRPIPPFTQEHEDFRAAVRQFVERELRPHAEEWEQACWFPNEVFHRLSELGYIGLKFPQRYGGDEDPIADAVFVEELARCGSGGLAAGIGAHSGIALPPIWKFGTDAQHERYLVPGIRGEKIAALAITEPDAGSDVSALRTSAKFDEASNEWVLNGQKAWATNGGIADVHVVIASVDRELGARGHAAFIVPMSEAKGISQGTKVSKHGLRASHTADVFLDDCRVPAGYVLGGKDKLDERLARVREGKKSKSQAAMQTFEASRPTVAAQALGIARAAYEYALDYAKEREQFGRKIIENQAIAFTLARMKLEIDATRLLVWRASWMGRSQVPFESAEGSMSKLKAGEVAVWVTERAIQILGGNGYTREFPVERWHRDAKIYDIFEGTAEIQQLVIARAISGMHIK